VTIDDFGFLIWKNMKPQELEDRLIDFAKGTQGNGHLTQDHIAQAPYRWKNSDIRDSGVRGVDRDFRLKHENGR
jgi:hypothetical protein